jgi:hypothetical protein
VNNQSFYDLHIGQTIYHNGRKEKIEQLLHQGANWLSLILSRQGCAEAGYTWSDICKDCSLELPNKYKVYEDLKLVKNGKLLKGEFLSQLNHHLEYNNELRELIMDIIDRKVEV